MCVCVCVCVYMYIHVYIYMYVYIYNCRYTFTHIYVYLYTHVHNYKQVHSRERAAYRAVEREHVVTERILGVTRVHERGGRKTDGYCDEVVIWMSRCGWAVL